MSGVLARGGVALQRSFFHLLGGAITPKWLNERAEPITFHVQHAGLLALKNLSAPSAVVSVGNAWRCPRGSGAALLSPGSSLSTALLLGAASLHAHCASTGCRFHGSTSCANRVPKAPSHAFHNGYGPPGAGQAPVCSSYEHSLHMACTRRAQLAVRDEFTQPHFSGDLPGFTERACRHDGCFERRRARGFRKREHERQKKKLDRLGSGAPGDPLGTGVLFGVVCARETPVFSSTDHVRTAAMASALTRT